MPTKKQKKARHKKILDRETRIARDRYGPNFFPTNVKKRAKILSKQKR